MKTLQIKPYGDISIPLGKLKDQDSPYRAWLQNALRWRRRSHVPVSQMWMTLSQDMDGEFVKLFHEDSAKNARLLVMNAGRDRQPTDNIAKRLLELQIHSPNRFYVADCPDLAVDQLSTQLATLIQRFAAASTDEAHSRILGATVFTGILRVVSTDFKVLNIPLSQIPSLAKQPVTDAMEFEIDEDGSFIYWPKPDVHLGWQQLTEIADPKAALKAKQKDAAFNVRFGNAVKRFREQTGLSADAIKGLSKKQLKRIESGECRLTSNAISSLADAHKLNANEYLSKLAAFAGK